MSDIIQFNGDLEQAIKMANLLADSFAVPENYQGKPADIIAAIQMGSEVGFKPIQSLQNICILDGYPTIYGDGMLALVRSSPLCAYVNETFDSDKMEATCTTKRSDTGEIITRNYSLKDAESAQLILQNHWIKHTKRMLQMRARSFCLRDAFPDVLKGLRMHEEVRDYTKQSKPETEKTTNKISRLMSLVDNGEKDNVIA